MGVVSSWEGTLNELYLITSTKETQNVLLEEIHLNTIEGPLYFDYSVAWIV